jgi:hypothetical protein
MAGTASCIASDCLPVVDMLSVAGRLLCTDCCTDGGSHGRITRVKVPRGDLVERIEQSSLRTTIYVMARTNLVYPKMPGSGEAPLGSCIAFEKYDGTNIHWVWEPTLGWYAFGTRRDRFDLDAKGIAEFSEAHPGLEQCADVFLSMLADRLSAVLNKFKYYDSKELIVFTEFLGENSFAGKHVSSDSKRLVIIDVQTSLGFLAPEVFVADLAELPIARTVYRGKLTGKFADDVREGRYGVAEGVVCKGESQGKVWMAKIKTNAYMLRLKEAFAERWEDYWE